MTRAEAEAWCIGSAYRDRVLHATSVEAAQEIRQHGFDLSHRAAGRIWENGVYAAIDQRTANHYLRHFGGRGTLLSLHVNVRRVLTARLLLNSPKRPLNQVLALLPAGLRRFLDGTMRDGDESAALTRLLMEEGYDALEIIADRFSRAIGGNQLVIFDPRQIVVVTDDDDASA